MKRTGITDKSRGSIQGFLVKYIIVLFLPLYTAARSSLGSKKTLNPECACIFGLVWRFRNLCIPWKKSKMSRFYLQVLQLFGPLHFLFKEAVHQRSGWGMKLCGSGCQVGAKIVPSQNGSTFDMVEAFLFGFEHWWYNRQHEKELRCTMGTDISWNDCSLPIALKGKGKLQHELDEDIKPKRVYRCSKVLNVCRHFQDPKRGHFFI